MEVKDSYLNNLTNERTYTIRSSINFSDLLKKYFDDISLHNCCENISSKIIYRDIINANTFFKKKQLFFKLKKEFYFTPNQEFINQFLDCFDRLKTCDKLFFGFSMKHSLCPV